MFSIVLMRKSRSAFLQTKKCGHAAYIFVIEFSGLSKAAKEVSGRRNEKAKRSEKKLFP